MARIALLGAMLCISQWITPIPNMEMISLLIIVYTLVFGRDTLYTILIFDLYMGIQGGFGLWWFSYLYTWPILYFTTVLLKRFIKDDFIIWSVVCGFFGLIFGALFAIAYIPLDPKFALTYWISGFTWDAFHGISNFSLTLALGKPLYNALKYLNGGRGLYVPE
jgi:hypothetical protein